MGALFEAAFPYADDLLALPVEDLDRAAEYYGQSFGMTEVERRSEPPTVVMERDGKQLSVFFVVAPDGLCYYFHQPLS